MKIVLMLLMLLMSAQPVRAAGSGKNFAGVGIDGKPLADGQIRVEQIVAAGPAHLAGIRVGDIITHIDGAATRGAAFQELVQKRLRGAAGTQVVLRIQRTGSDKPLTFTLTRRQMVVTNAKEKQ